MNFIAEMQILKRKNSQLERKNEKLRLCLRDIRDYPYVPCNVYHLCKQVLDEQK